MSDADVRSWEERQLTTIIIRAAESAAHRWATGHDICRYLIAAMDWFVAARPPPPEITNEDMFEAWLVERWLKHARSEAYQDTAEYQFLRGEWERGQQ